MADSHILRLDTRRRHQQRRSLVLVCLRSLLPVLNFTRRKRLRHCARKKTVSVRWTRTLRHATDSYTEGLSFVGDRLLENVGWTGQSRLLELNPESGDTLWTVAWPERFVGDPVSPDGLDEGFLIRLDGHGHGARFVEAEGH